MVIFKDPILQEEFNKNGYVIIDLLSTKEVDSMKAVYKECFPRQDDEFYINVYDTDFDKRKIVSTRTQALLKPYTDKLFNNFKFVVSAFTYKKSGTSKDFQMHQDITITDEDKFPSISIWCPLQDVDATNGALYIVPHTHKLPSTARGYNLPSRIEKIPEYITTNYARLVPLRKGQAIIWDHRLLHGSGPNHTNVDRIASVSLLVPHNAPILLYYAPKPPVNNVAAVEVLEMADGYYDTYDVKTKPSGEAVSVYKTEEIEIKFFTENEFDTIARQISTIA